MSRIFPRNQPSISVKAFIWCESHQKHRSQKWLKAREILLWNWTLVGRPIYTQANRAVQLELKGYLLRGRIYRLVTHNVQVVVDRRRTRVGLGIPSLLVSRPPRDTTHGQTMISDDRTRSMSSHRAIFPLYFLYNTNYGLHSKKGFCWYDGSICPCMIRLNDR